MFNVQDRINALEQELKNLYNEALQPGAGCCNEMPTQPATTIEMQDALLQRSLKRVDYRPPSSDQIPRYQNLRDGAKAFITVIVRNCPVLTEETNQAIRIVEAALMTANKSIALEND